MPYKIADKYEKRIVAFIDILGFSELIKKTEQEGAEGTEMIRKIQMVIYLLHTKITSGIRLNTLPSGTMASMFSDSILVSIPKAESKGVLTLFRFLKELQVQLVPKRILLRGGIVFGELIHNKDLVVGPALINAYEVESKSAVYPRIVIDPNVLYLYSRRNGVTTSKLRLSDKINEDIKRDFDGTWYIDYFNSLEGMNRPVVRAYIIALGEMIKGVSRIRNKTGLRMKYMWMKEKLNDSDYSHFLKELKK